MWSESFDRSVVLVSCVFSCHTQKHLLSVHKCSVQEAAFCALYSYIPHVPSLSIKLNGVFKQEERIETHMPVTVQTHSDILHRL